MADLFLTPTFRTASRLLIVGATIGLVACRDTLASSALVLHEIDPPAGEGSGEPNLFSHGDSVYLSWLEPIEEGRHALRFAVRDGDEWSEARTIASGSDYFVNWADFPSVVALPDGRVAAHWLVRSGPGTYAYDVRIAQSADGGRTWGPSVVPHRDGTQTEHGFVSLFPWEADQLAAIWLDGRNFVGEGEQDGHGSGAEMTLRHTTVAPDGRLGAETLLDERICDCCQTSVALTSRGPIAVYRDRSAEEVRDIAVVRYLQGRWTEPRVIHADGWQIPGCPVNGPAAAARGERVVVAWFTAANEAPRVHVAFSADAGESFAAPIRVDDGDPIGRVDAVILENGDALVSWLERVDESAEIRVRRIQASGERGPAWLVSSTSAARAAGFPRMVQSGNELVFAWTEAGEPSRVRTAVARLR